MPSHTSGFATSAPNPVPDCSAAESRNARRVRRAVEGEPEEEARQPDDQQIDRDADHDLIGAKTDRGHGVEQREQHAAGHRAEQTDPRAARCSSSPTAPQNAPPSM